LPRSQVFKLGMKSVKQVWTLSLAEYKHDEQGGPIKKYRHCDNLTHGVSEWDTYIFGSKLCAQGQKYNCSSEFVSSKQIQDVALFC